MGNPASDLVPPNRRTQTSGRWPLYAGLAVYWLTVLLLAGASVRCAGGQLVYPLDDTYIHMAMAKNAALHQVWGVTKHGFASSTSSPLWTATLAGSYVVFGVNERAPLVLNLLFGTSLVVALFRVLSTRLGSPLLVVGVLLLTVFAAPLPTLTVLGMEHVLHALVSVALFSVALRGLLDAADNGRSRAKAMLVLATLGALLTATRYEGLFLVLMVCLLYAARKRTLEAVVVGAGALLPIAAYGLWSRAHGWFLLPNSVLLKGQRPEASFGDLADLVALGVAKLFIRGDVLALLLASAFVWAVAGRARSAPGMNAARHATVVFAGTVILHVLLASIDGFYRYEAYLVVLGIVALATSLPMLRDALGHPRGLIQHAVAAVLLVGIGASLGQRTWGALRDTPLASANIHGQQYQMGRFIARFHQGATVAVNDLGAVAYLADVRIVDLWGLGSLEPAMLRLDGAYNPRDLERIVSREGVELAVVYDRWFDRFGGLPPAWQAVARWTIPDNIVGGDDTVTFYAMDEAARGRLVQSLRRFSSSLPARVVQQGPDIRHGFD